MGVCVDVFPEVVMKLLLRRDQRAAMLGGKPVFQLDVRADLDRDEKAAIEKYKLGGTLLYEKKPMKEGGNDFQLTANAILWRTMNLIITVNDLEKGKRIECKDILEMLGAEEQVKEAAQAFKLMLEACRHFGGEEVVEV
jgi:hypothetical protein